VGFYEIAPCLCCSGRVPANRSWPESTCTPSCWTSLKPNERARLLTGSGDESHPCLACQDRIGERTSTRVQPPPSVQTVLSDHRDWLAEQATSTRGAA
jgi:hypothetical protein